MFGLIEPPVQRTVVIEFFFGGGGGGGCMFVWGIPSILKA